VAKKYTSIRWVIGEQKISQICDPRTWRAFWCPIRPAPASGPQKRAFTSENTKNLLLTEFVRTHHGHAQFCKKTAESELPPQRCNAG